ncbi:hypothetical protein NYE67_09665 [Solibacillus sp. FSL W8-0474]|uniref:hypothetical protein n=1 Tax=Solibacillus sp. FSL W8-0474 TaxID=2975336 RepID=UPI0030F9ABCE
MSKLKQAFDEQFGDLSTSRNTIKNNVLYKQFKRKRKIHWQYSIIATIVLFVAVGFLWAQMPMNKEQQRLGTLSKQYFEVTYFDTFYLSQMFNRKAENYEEVFFHVVQEAAIIDYAKSQGIVVTDAEVESLIRNFLVSFKEGKQNSQMTAFRYEILFKEFKLTDEKYARLLSEQQLVSALYSQRLFEKLKIDQNPNDQAYMEVVNDALTAYYGKYSTQVEDMLADFQPIPSGSLSGPVETLRTSYGEFKVVELEGNLRFAQKSNAVDQLLINGMEDINAIMEEENLGYLCYYTLDDYIKSSNERMDSSESAEDLFKLLTILKDTVELY